MRVLHVLNTNSYSGAENVAITIINHMPDVDKSLTDDSIPHFFFFSHA